MNVLRSALACCTLLVVLSAITTPAYGAPSGSASSPAPETERLYLSGRGPADAVPWEFTVTAGRRAGEKSTLPVPSHWEQHGFGTYHYGEQRLKTEERGLYRTTFHIPATWAGRRIRLVFAGAMTDTSAKVNGLSAGPVHQGGFTQFRYDITALVKFDAENVLEVEVAEMSADALTERAERGGDYWIFGGIYRPVYLESLPPQAIDHVAIDARADGTFSADVTLGALRDKTRPDGPSLLPEKLEAQIFDAVNQPVGAPFGVKIPGGGAGRLRLETKIQEPRLWTAETPHLYTVEIRRTRADEIIHTTTTRFGFRTFEIRDGDGLYLNGQRILLKGVNRHSFRPATGRALNRDDCYEDVRQIRAMNMNAVRMSHYPPDEAFLEACDELGLYVLDELSGWQAAHGTAIGRLLVRELVERDVNHPSIIIWDNGNEGGWNRDLDGDFALYDPQQRPVLHPWDPFGGVDTRHYTAFADHVRRLKGPNLVMPTEILHALYDGGAGAGLHDYWQAIVNSPFGAGAFIWDYADEGIRRTDRNGQMDVFATFAPDGIVGPNLEPEGSYHAVRHVWSPVQIDPPVLDEKFDGTLTLHNHYDFTPLAACRVEWMLTRFEENSSPVTMGMTDGPAIVPHATGTMKIGLPANWREADALVLTIKNPRGEPVWTWTWPTLALERRMAPPPTAPAAKLDSSADQLRLSAGKTTALFNAHDGTLLSFNHDSRSYVLTNGPRLVYARPLAAAPVAWLPWRDDTAPEALTRHLATPQTASVIEVEVENRPPYFRCRVELSPDGKQWKTIFDGARRPSDGGRYEFPPQPVAAVRLSTPLHTDGSPLAVKSVRLGHAAARFPAEPSPATTVTTGTDARGAWLKATNGNLTFRWSLTEGEALRLDYDYVLEGTFLYHGISFDHADDQVKGKRWVGEGPFRVWQNRLHGTTLGLHSNSRHILQPGESFDYPEFEGFFAGVRRMRLDTDAGPLTIVSAQPETFLRIGTPRISHPYTTVEFPAGDLSLLHAIPGMGSKFKWAHESGPTGEPAKASGTYRGTLVFIPGNAVP
jgi:hypothetical protein